MKKMRKFFLLLMLTVLFACSGTSLSVHASAKTLPRRAVKQFFKYAKTVNESKMYKYVNEELTGTTDDAFTKSQQKQLTNIVKAENKKKYKYKVVSTVLSSDKKSATVKVRITYNSLYTAGRKAMDSVYDKLIAYTEKNKKTPKDSLIGKWLVRELKAAVRKYPAKVQTRTIPVKVKKYDSGWKIVRETNAMMNAYSCDIVKGIEASVDNFD